MARPIKNYCDYFPHDMGMRNHRKIKALRTKFGVVGYGIWNMLLEYLTGINGNEFQFSDIEIGLIAGDFGISDTELSDVINFCLKFDLLSLNQGFIHSESLDERLKPVYEKRNLSKVKSNEQYRSNGKFVKKYLEDCGVSVTETPQIKLKEIKLKETILDNGTWDNEKNLFLNAEQWQMKQCSTFSLSKDDIQGYIKIFLDRLESQEDYKSEKELKRHFNNWLEKHLEKNKAKLTNNTPTPYEQDRLNKISSFKPIRE